MNAASNILRIVGLTHRYGERVALDNIHLDIGSAGELFAILGPNGGGKTTLFRILSTLLAPQSGQVFYCDQEIRQAVQLVRSQLGIVFQAPSLDKKLSVYENIWCQGRLYGIDSATIRKRADELLARFSLTERKNDRVETLSGGLKRRVEIAKSLLHAPKILILDEPSTGLDPLVRAELWDLLQELRKRDGMTVLLTTHFLEEADKADRIAILHQGKIVALDSPIALRSSLAGDTLTIASATPDQLASEIERQFSLRPKIVDRAVRLEIPAAHEWIAKIVNAFPSQIEAITLGKPSLEDVFVARTGQRFHAVEAA